MIHSKLHIKIQKFFGLSTVFVCILFFQNCGAPQHTGGIGSSSNSSLMFESAQSVITKKCVACHNSSTGRNFDFSSESQFIQSNLVLPGNPQNSKLIYRLKRANAKASTDPAVLIQNMPPNSALSEDEFQTIYSWIEKMPTNISPVVCNSDDNLLKPQIKRLTGAQFRSSIEAAFGAIFTDSQFPDLNDGNPRLSLANDPEILSVNEINISFFYDSIVSILTTAIAQVADLKSCVSAATDTCYSTLMDNYSLKLWRRPISSQEQMDLQKLLTDIPLSSRASKVQTLLTAMLLSPNHLYRSEIGSQVLATSTNLQLSHYEVAAFLSFTLWDGPPDDILLNLARTNQLYSLAVLREQSNRMMADSRFNKKMSQFIVDLLKIEDVKKVIKDPSYNFTQSEKNDLYSSAVSSINAVYSTPAANIYAAFSTSNFAVNQNVARFFNISSSGLPTQLTPRTMDANQRYGMLSHPAFLASISNQVESGIVKRGVFTLEQLLCHHLGSPPPNVAGLASLPPDFNPALLSSREVLQKTHSSQSSCIGCHASIDPSGFAYENFNTLGQFRTTEKSNIPIDSSGVIIGATSTLLSFNDSIGFFKAIEKNSDFKKCIQEKFFLFTAGQSAETGPGLCEYNNLATKMKTKDESIKSLFESIIELDSFTRRKPASK